MVQKDIDEVTIQNNIIQQKQKLEQLEIKYLLCNTSTNAYLAKITRNLELMENIKHEENEENIKWYEHHNWTSIWKNGIIFLNHLQNQTIDKSTWERVHPYTNINHTRLDQNSQPP